jgi:hypothetical protein
MNFLFLCYLPITLVIKNMHQAQQVKLQFISANRKLFPLHFWWIGITVIQRVSEDIIDSEAGKFFQAFRIPGPLHFDL